MSHAADLNGGGLWQPIAERLSTLRVIPVVSFDDADQAEATAGALLRGGVDCMEVTFRTPAAVEAIKRVRQIDGVFVAAGTVLSADQIRQATDAGAQLAFAPGTNRDVIDAAGEAGLPLIPGVATPSEIEQLRHAGQRIVKVFPAGTLGGPAFLRAVAAVYPDMRFIPTGGIDGESVHEYAELPSVLAVGGSWLAPPALIRAGAFDEIERRASEARLRALA